MVEPSTPDETMKVEDELQIHLKQIDGTQI